MYLKIRVREQEKNGPGVRDRWFIISKVEELNYSWVDFEDEQIYQEGNRTLLSKVKEGNPTTIRKINVFRTNDNIADTIYCDDNVYLCNDNGQTIERL